MWWLILLIALIVLWRAFLWRPRSLPGVTRRGVDAGTLLIGHRGLRGSLPENSLEAFTAAFEADLDGIEFDVQQSHDGDLVITHNFELAGEEVSALTTEQLRRAEPTMPLLSELLELAERYPGRLLNLEVKARGLRTRGLEFHVAQVVRHSSLQGRVLISSFNPFSLLRVRLIAPELRTALLYAPDSPRWLRNGTLAGWLHVDAVHPQHTQVNEALMAWARRRHLGVNTWTVNDAAEVKRLLALGVNGITADDPEALKAAVEAGGRA